MKELAQKQLRRREIFLWIVFWTLFFPFFGFIAALITKAFYNLDLAWTIGSGIYFYLCFGITFTILIKKEEKKAKRRNHHL